MKKMICRAIILLLSSILMLPVDMVFAVSNFSGYTEDFESLPEGTFVCPNWNVVRSSEIVDLGESGKAVKLEGKEGRIIWNPEEPITNSFYVETEFMQETAQDVHAIINPSCDPWGADNMSFIIGTNNGNITLRQKVEGYSDEYVTNLVENYQTNVFYKIAVYCNMVEKTFIVWINDESMFDGTEIPFLGKSVPGIDRFNFQIDTSSGDMYINSFRVLPAASKEELGLLIDACRACDAQTSVGNLAGNCTMQAKEEFNAAIDQAEEAYDNAVNSLEEMLQQVLVAYNELQEAYEQFTNSLLTEDIDISELAVQIDHAKEILSEAAVGEAMGQVPETAVSELTDAINSAQEFYEEIYGGGDASELKDMITWLSDEVEKFVNSKNKEYKTLFFDDFEGLPEGASAADFNTNGWTTMIGYVSTAKEENNMSAVLSVEGRNGNSRLLKTFDSGQLADDSILEFSFMLKEAAEIEQIAEAMSDQLGANNLLFEISSDINNIYIKHSGGKREQLISNYLTDKWYDIKIAIDIPNKTFKIDVDGTPAFSGSELEFSGNEITAFSRLGIRVISDDTFAGKKDLYIDNVRVYRDLTSDYEKIADEVTAGFGDINGIYRDIELVKEYDGANIEWEISNTDLISSEGEVDRPWGHDETCVLTMHIKKDGYEYVKKLTVTVLGINSDITYSENFETVPEGSVPSDMQTETGSCSSVNNIDGNKCLFTDDKNKVTVAQQRLYPSGIIDFKFYVAEGSGDIFELSNEQYSLAKIKYEDDSVVIIDKEGEAKTECLKSVWNTVSLAVDLKKNTFDVYCNDELIASDKEFANSNTSELFYCAWGGSGAETYFDDLSIYVQEVNEIEFISGADEILKATKSDIQESYEVLVLDAKGRRINSCSLMWEIKNKDGMDPNGMSVLNGTLTVSPEAEPGEYELKVTSPQNGKYISKTIMIKEQELEQIKITGNSNINRAGEFIYSAQGVSVYGTVVPLEDVLWSVSGDTYGVSMTDSGKLRVSANSSGSIKIIAESGGIEAEYPVRISINNSVGGGSGGSGGGGGGGTFAAANVGQSAPVQGSMLQGTGENIDDTSDRSFVDLETVSWAKDAIDELYKRGIINGVDDIHFMPEANVTREQFTKMMISAFDFSANGYSGDMHFTDIPNERWSYSYIEKAYDLGIIEGCGDGSFGAEDPITREDVSVIIARALGKMGVGLEAGTLGFDDKNDISNYAYNSVAALNKAGIINGRDDNMFDPTGKTTRAEAAVIIFRAIGVAESR